MSAWWGHVPFAHWFVALLKPRSIVELGTHTGVSFTAFCEAVQRSTRDGGTMRPISNDGRESGSSSAASPIFRTKPSSA
ncbi:hypothetical protein [Prosthecomicrobium pneumaticum]|uniref:Methyltransferase n=1 Tax=Prosthecomicrobium pneumaticum TaxID=81895 RepID=A0A7W9L2D9_9HYPH|nr:hypothetical protein [Prosthecomicrobium pneumaticum]MBB5753413.1 hypothetical protein [Prosthecomicrobium pneumaticum]